MKNIQKRRKSQVSLGTAIWAEMRDRIAGIRLGISVSPMSFVRFGVTLVLMILFLMLQTTFFVRFAPFGAVPDLMLAFISALAVSEGKEKGGIWGLVAALLVECLGGTGMNLQLLPLLYFPCGYFIGYAAKEHLSDTIPVRAIYISLSCLLRSIITSICSMSLLSANLLQILGDIVIPEFFSTLIMSIPIHVLVWLCFRKIVKKPNENPIIR